MKTNILKKLIMKKIIAAFALILLIGSITGLVLAHNDDKPKKAKTEQCQEKKDCEKACCQKTCAPKCNSVKPTVEKK